MAGSFGGDPSKFLELMGQDSDAGKAARKSFKQSGLMGPALSLANKQHDMGLEYSKPQDMSQYANLGSLQSMMQPIRQPEQMQQMPSSMHPYIRSLMGG